jgi:GntR family transcriptional regulator, transcriptional repressor for pyruvate dehydrogenase complex
MSVVFEPIKTQTVRIQVVEQIARMIKEGRLKPGDQLPSERVIAEQMGISRPTVREAFAALEVAGLVETRIGQGTFVKPGDVESLKYRAEYLFVEERSPFETLETRKILESQAAALSAERATVEDLSDLKAALDILTATATSQNEWNEEADKDFHVAIAKASGNSVLYDLFKVLLDMSQHRVWSKMKEIGRQTTGSLENDVAQHRMIYEAIRDKDPRKARQLVWDHFVGVERDIFGLDR